MCEEEFLRNAQPLSEFLDYDILVLLLDSYDETLISSCRRAPQKLMKMKICGMQRDTFCLQFKRPSNQKSGTNDFPQTIRSQFEMFHLSTKSHMAPAISL